MIDKTLAQNRVFTLFVAIILVIVVMVLVSIKKYFDAKTAHEISESALEIKKYEWVVGPSNPANIRMDPMHIRMEGTTRLFELIDVMIANEVASILFSYTMVNKDYPLQKLDVDIKEGATNVMNGLSKENLLDKNLFVTHSYISQYIMRVMTQELIEKAREFNGARRQQTMNEE